MKYLTHVQDQVRPNCKDILLLGGKCFHFCLLYGCYYYYYYYYYKKKKKKKKKGIGIWNLISNLVFLFFVFEEAQEINFQGNLQGSKCDGDISMRTFFVLRKSSFLHWTCGFFQNIFTPTAMFLTDLH